ncbi:MAG: hypothetical protein F4Y63_08590 [Chloroflexi bacterium]|nr:hypothetical protein [Chloroflexota bacterium]MYK61238.1 hypothetical protein [Chloroflexota bacterium]
MTKRRRVELPELNDIKCKYAHLTPEQFAQKMRRFRVPDDWDEITADLDRQYEEQQQRQREHERRLSKP